MLEAEFDSFAHAVNQLHVNGDDRWRDASASESQPLTTTPEDEQILFGASGDTSGNWVEELVVYPRDNDGYAWIYLDWNPGYGSAGQYAANVQSDAFAFALSKAINTTGQNYGQAYLLERVMETALEGLYILAKGVGETLDGPGAFDIQSATIMDRLNVTTAFVETNTVNIHNAYTLPESDGSFTIHMDPARMAGYVASLGSEYKAAVYVAFHELGHVLLNGQGTEAQANEMGQVLAERLGYQNDYPTDQQFEAVWGPGFHAPR